MGGKKKPSLFNSSPEREDAFSTAPEVASVFKLSDLIPQVLFKSALITATLKGLSTPPQAEK
jgi:hypothetical protein